MTIRIGIAGVQHPHMDAILDDAAAHTGAELVGLAERDPRLRAEYAQRYRVAAFEDHTQLLDAGELDAILVGDVFGARGRIIADALGHGLHVLTDKPMCTTPADLDAIHHAWRGGDRVLTIAFEKRFLPATLALSELLDAGELGEIVMVTSAGPHKLIRDERPAWMFHDDTYGGILNDLVVHDIDLLLHLTGAASGTVRGYAGNRCHADVPEFEDHGLAVIQVDDGPLASLDAHWMSPQAAPYFGDIAMTVVGTHGTAELRWIHNRLILGTHHRPPAEIPLPGRRSATRDFLDALTDGRPPAVTAHASFAATAVALAAQRSARLGHPVTWDVDTYRREPADARTSTTM
ncbi:Gfo/Idh/MocA family protein [Phytoactinopolyspora halotolerans]|uniref:Gfo/Idh/MocA family oxidoreductase n=1 Tax=Phytoactinopolyspora halotolerans TaxID=1981512 RepID=A0A6L9SA33_9ACTN|nr:Gfo/Idh/MocA family oxidoreductase [Phytoactinopolyspora halotolerans]NEE02235.1 Gfo/Idh/MocA family oxidoreductase [Phytoactinopolyspora halotolerans]